MASCSAEAPTGLAMAVDELDVRGRLHGQQAADEQEQRDGDGLHAVSST